MIVHDTNLRVIRGPSVGPLTSGLRKFELSDPMSIGDPPCCGKTSAAVRDSRQVGVTNSDLCGLPGFLEIGELNGSPTKIGF